MTRKKRLPSQPSKAYLVSFGDTMTALLAFFIVMNSLAKDQTGANMYAGTGSFARAFTASGQPGGMVGRRSDEMIQQAYQQPVYALAENLNQEGDIGPDDSGKDKIKDRDQEQFQKFLNAVEQDFGLEQQPKTEQQIVIDSFEPIWTKQGALGQHAVQLLAQTIPKLREPNVDMQLIIWASVPSQKNLEVQLVRLEKLKAEVLSKFWIKPSERNRILFRTRPWLFADAKRPVFSIVVAERETSPAADLAE
ncbi:MAG: hypothetical protein NXI32_13320 [bacterium]|nr:hypothetical protein [bacterium]